MAASRVCRVLLVRIGQEDLPRLCPIAQKATRWLQVHPSFRNDRGCEESANFSIILQDQSISQSAHQYGVLLVGESERAGAPAEAPPVVGGAQYGLSGKASAVRLTQSAKLPFELSSVTHDRRKLCVFTCRSRMALRQPTASRNRATIPRSRQS